MYLIITNKQKHIETKIKITYLKDLKINAN